MAERGIRCGRYPGATRPRVEQVVVDSSVLAASFLPDDSFHQQSLSYIDGLEAGDYIFHLPMLVWIEVLASVSRRARRNRVSLLSRARQSFGSWESAGKIILYPLDRDRMNRAVNISERYSLRGADSVVAALADELDLPLRAYDREILERYELASP